MRETLACLKQSQLSQLDLYTELERLKAADSDRFRRYFHLHMTREGNAFIAGRVASYILSQLSP